MHSSAPIMPTPPIAYLHDFRPLHAGARLCQADAVAWLQGALVRAGGPGTGRARRLYERLGRTCGVKSRETVVGDYARADPRRMTLFRAGPGRSWRRPPLEERMALYEAASLRLAARAVPAGRAPDWLIQVSCTGYASPHAVQRLAGRRGWDSRILHLGHMGCHASLPAAALAADLVRGAGRAGARARVFCVELCTLHLVPDAREDEQVVVNSLFGDGAVSFEASARPRPRSLALLAAAEAVLPGSEGDMVWRLADSAFVLGLSRAVPARVGAETAGFVARFLKAQGLRLADVAHYAIHPGGPRVIERVLQALDLPPSAARHSKEVLRRRGNMSSCTLPFVWADMLKDPAVRPGDKILSLAFGPGLTTAANLLEKRA